MESMSPKAHDPETAVTPPSHKAVNPAEDAKKPLPGMIAGIGSIIAGVLAFCIPIVGMVAACVGIWLGILAVRQGRAGRYMRSVVCGAIGIAMSALSIVYWVCVVLFESYH